MFKWSLACLCNHSNVFEDSLKKHEKKFLRTNKGRKKGRTSDKEKETIKKLFGEGMEKKGVGIEE